MHVIDTRLTLPLALGCALLAAQGIASEASGQAAAQPAQEQRTPGAAVARTTEAVATVEAIDRQTREVVLRAAGGNLVTAKAGPEVQNLDRVQVGDRVAVRYTEALAASLAKPDQGGGSAVQAQGGIARALSPEGRPAAAGDQVRATVRIEAVDRAANTVTFVGPAGAVRTVAVRDPDAQRFLQTLGPGDRVELVYTEAVAIVVEPAQR
jgi:hypothetical protein